jgi:hypothetical protein
MNYLDFFYLCENHHTVNVESEQTAQIIQPTNPPYGIPSSSK